MIVLNLTPTSKNEYEGLDDKGLDWMDVALLDSDNMARFCPVCGRAPKECLHDQTVYVDQKVAELSILKQIVAEFGDNADPRHLLRIQELEREQEQDQEQDNG